MGTQIELRWPFPWDYAIALIRDDADQPLTRPCGCAGDRGAHRYKCALRKRAPGVGAMGVGVMGVGAIQDTIEARAMRLKAHRWFRARRPAVGKRHSVRGCAHVANIFAAIEGESCKVGF